MSRRQLAPASELPECSGPCSLTATLAAERGFARLPGEQAQPPSDSAAPRGPATSRHSFPAFPTRFPECRTNGSRGPFLSCVR